MAQFFKPQRRKVADTRHKLIKITRLDTQGAGVGGLDGKTVFVEGVLPGEEALIQITEQKRQYARAKLIKVQQASSQRQAPFCQYYGRCGGCNLQHLTYSAQVEHKKSALVQLMSRAAGENVEAVTTETLSSQDQSYRRSCRLSLWVDKQHQLQMGFRQRSSKAIIDIARCPVLMPSLSALLPELKALLVSFTQPKQLGHIELVEADNGVVLMLRHLSGLKADHLARLDAFAATHQLMLFTSVDGQTIVQRQGEKPFYTIEGEKIWFTPGDFIQINRTVNAAMVARALAWLEPTASDRVLDLFCGLGNFSLPLARQVAEVVGVEGVDDMVARAKKNAEHNQIHNAAFYQANLEDDIHTQPWAQKAFNKVLLDPARGGAAGVMAHLLSLAPQRIVYVSCNPATLARDSKELLDNGYRLSKLCAMDMFPHTGHSESMALFTKL
ncbi:23S rRNA (uracil(1939)-C(5))-methyltransferase RlmD [Thaumasiovibrio sp. DFM-14]|uniref:23S rRNA (uracil(1939)-C(5))-methyltransferase RlmD n=1 Tax=Thaumasiovibrio sp. DFM-14 TaxID=3384792 RepID=UPI0039A31734